MDYSWISFFGCRSGGRALKIKSEAPVQHRAAPVFHILLAYVVKLVSLTGFCDS